MNRREKTIFMIGFALLFLLLITISGSYMNEGVYSPNYELKKLSPSINHLFGTDYLGRDMFFRTVKGLSTSIKIGILAAGISSIIALFLGLFSALAGGVADKIVNLLIDLFMGVPHLVLLMLISFMMGKGEKGVIVGIALSHWPNLARIVRAEVIQVRSSQYVQSARKLGKSNLYIATKHLLPHVLPQYMIGLLLLFPHAILHEASITFLGFGLSLDMPAIGVILSEAMKHIATGMWWLVFFPGAALLAVVMMFDTLGENLKLLIDPNSSQE